MSNSKNIYQRINAVINEKIYLKKGSAGQGTGVLYDELLEAVRDHLAKHGIIVIPEKIGEARSRQNSKDNYVYECDFNIHYVNMDDPSDRFTCFVESHAMDSGDKAPGKAITYATKISMLKIFQIETGINDESREEGRERVKRIDREQLKEIKSEISRTGVDPSKVYSKYGAKSLADLAIASFNDAMKLLAEKPDAEKPGAEKAAK